MNNLYSKGIKAVFKSELKYIPIVGIGAYFAENIFIKRKWETDKDALTHGLKNFFYNYPKNSHFNVYKLDFDLLIFYRTLPLKDLRKYTFIL